MPSEAAKKARTDLQKKNRSLSDNFSQSFAVLGQVQLFGSPEGGFGFFVHLPNIVVLDREQNESFRVFSQNWFYESLLYHFLLLLFCFDSRNRVRRPRRGGWHGFSGRNAVWYIEGRHFKT